MHVSPPIGGYHVYCSNRARSTYTSFHFMSRFTSLVASDSATAGGASDGLTLNALTVTGAALGAATVGGSLFVAATVAPAQTVGLSAAAALCAAAGQRQAAGKSIIPGTGNASTATPAAEPVAETAAA